MSTESTETIIEEPKPTPHWKMKQKIAKIQANQWRYVKRIPLPAPKARRLGLNEDEAKSAQEASNIKIAQPYEGVLEESKDHV